MSKYHAVNPSTKKCFPLHHLPSYLGPDLDLGFDVDLAGLISTSHKEFSEVSGTLTPLPKTTDNHILTLNSRTQTRRKGFRFTRLAVKCLNCRPNLLMPASAREPE